MSVRFRTQPVQRDALGNVIGNALRVALDGLVSARIDCVDPLVI
jgi:hypothetical protein